MKDMNEWIFILKNKLLILQFSVEFWTLGGVVLVSSNQVV